VLNRSGCATAASQFADATYETPLTPVWGVPSRVATYTGAQLLGLGLSAPNAKYPVVYTLPLLTISMTKGTGVFRSVCVTVCVGGGGGLCTLHTAYCTMCRKRARALPTL
jgi:hypothetical protein